MGMVHIPNREVLSTAQKAWTGLDHINNVLTKIRRWVGVSWLVLAVSIVIMLTTSVESFSSGGWKAASIMAGVLVPFALVANRISTLSITLNDHIARAMYHYVIGMYMHERVRGVRSWDRIKGTRGVVQHTGAEYRVRYYLDEDEFRFWRRDQDDAWTRVVSLTTSDEEIVRGLLGTHR